MDTVALFFASAGVIASSFVSLQRWRQQGPSGVNFLERMLIARLGLAGLVVFDAVMIAGLVLLSLTVGVAPVVFAGMMFWSGPALVAIDAKMRL
jgi:hypothetical protein